MEKKNFYSLVAAVIGGLLFGIGMCMCLIPEWNAFNQGVAVAAAGAIILLVLAGVRRKMSGKPAVKISFKMVGIVIYSICSALLLGTGMCMIMVWDMMIYGIIVGVAGIMALLFLIPLIRGFK